MDSSAKKEAGDLKKDIHILSSELRKISEEKENYFKKDKKTRRKRIKIQRKNRFNLNEFTKHLT